MKPRKNLVVPVEIVPLLDPTERQAAMTVFREFNGSPEVAETIRRDLVEPLELWAESEYQKWGRHTGVDAAIELAGRGEDLAEHWFAGAAVVPEMLDALESHWRDLTEAMGFAGIDLWDKDESRRKTGSKNGGQSRTGYKAPLTQAIIAMCQSIPECSYTSLLVEMEADARGQECLLYNLRETGQVTVKFVSVTSEHIFYDELNGKQGKKLAVRSLPNKLSMAKGIS
ncbi:hypothetical protein [Saccharospirillum sp.]|uniref:hypothetical protein n=1 Tax=Saccharospirillum sp. TaxID=2033801 RepID=UPI00349FEDD7